MTIYNFADQDLAWTNVLLMCAVGFYFIIAAIRIIKEMIYMKRIGQKVSDIHHNIVGCIMAFVVAGIIISGTLLLFFHPFSLEQKMRKGDYYEVQGYPELVEFYQTKTGNDDKYEFIITVNGIMFDTYNSYGVANKFDKNELQDLKNHQVNIKYTIDSYDELEIMVMTVLDTKFSK